MKYFAMIDGEQRGPFELEQLPEVGVRPTTYIWCKGMADWEQAADVAEVCRLYRNHLYDIMHPSAPSLPIAADANESPSSPAYPSRFDRFIDDGSGQGLPSIEEINSREDIDKAPVSVVPYAWLVTFFCCIPTGIAALVFAYKSKSAWRHGERQLAHDYCRAAKMWTGISFFLGLIIYSFALFSISFG